MLLLALNGVFAMSEIAVVSSRKAKLQSLADEGSARAANTLKLAENPNRHLATVQIGIILVGILAGAYGGTTFAEFVLTTPSFSGQSRHLLEECNGARLVQSVHSLGA